MRNIQIALVGQPNVGKSTLFSRLTGVGVITSNYPGTTVEFEEATVTSGDLELHFHDLPGTYSLSANSEDEKIVLNMLQDEKNDIVLVIADASNPEPGLVLSLEVIELGLPTIIVMNKFDLASKKFKFDIEKMTKILGVPVIPLSSKTGEGTKELLDAICNGKACVSDFITLFDDHIEESIQKIKKVYPNTTNGQIVKWLEGISIGEKPDDELISNISSEFRKNHKDPIDVHIARDRYGEAHAIILETVSHSERVITKKEKISEIMTDPLTGIPILVCVLVIVFGILVLVGGLIANGIDSLYNDLGISNALINFGESIGGHFGKAIFVGIDSSIQAILGLVIPYIMVFYIMLGILEDSGYLPRAVVLLDKLMHKFGLHGGGFIPMMVGLGCNVPAVLATRTVRSRREKIILCAMICMAVPCSAQLAIIAGVTSNYGGILWFIGILLILVVLGVIAGLVLNKFMKYEPSNLAIELPELQWPMPSIILKKMWMRSSDFFKLAVPFLIIGSIIIGILIEYNLLNQLCEPMSWLTNGLLGLPPTVIICFIAGIVRKEMSYAMLGQVGALEIMQANPYMFITYGVVMSIYFPCIAAFVAMKKEVGLKNTLIISLISITVAVLIGAVINLCFTL